MSSDSDHGTAGSGVEPHAATGLLVAQLISDPAIQVSPRGHILGANPLAARLCRRSRGALVGLPLDQLILPAPETAAARDGPAPPDGPLWIFRHPPGQPVAGVLRRPGGPAMALRACCVELARGEMLLLLHPLAEGARISPGAGAPSAIDAQHRAILENTGTAMIIAEEDCTIAVSNAHFQQLCGHTAEEIDGRLPWTLFVHPDDLGRLMGYHRHRHRGDGEAPNDYEFRFLSRDGDTRQVRVYIDLLPGSRRSIASLIDVTEQKQAAGAILAQRDLGLALARATGLEEALRACLDAALRVSAMDSGGIYLIDRATGAADLAVARGFGPGFIQRVAHYEPDSTHAQLVRAGAPVYVGRAELDLSPFTEAIGEGIRAVAILPIRHDGRAIACMNVASHSAAAISAPARASLETIGGQIGAILSRFLTEKALGESMRRWHDLLGVFPSGLFIFDVETPDVLRLAEWNPEAERLAQFELEPFRGGRLDEIWPAVAGTPIPEMIRRALQTGQVQQIEECYFQGRRRRLLLRLRFFPMPDGRLGVAFEDITETARTQKALQEVRERYRYITEAVSEYLYSVRLVNGRPAEIAHGPACEAVTGYTPAELSERPELWRACVHPDDLPGLDAHVEAALAGGETRAHEFRIVRKDGCPRWVRHTIIRHYDPERALKSYDALVQDITDRKQAEEALRLSEENHRAVVENTSEAICVAKGGRLHFVNPAMERLSGYSAAELIEIPFLQLVHAADRAVVARRHARRLRGEELWPVYQFRFVCKDGTIRWAEINAVRISWEGETATLNFLTDVTERRLAVDQLQESRRALSSLMSSLPGIAYRCANDRHLTMEFVSDGARDLTGYQAEDLIGTEGVAFADLIHPADRERVWSEVQEALEARRHFQLVYRIITAEGQVRWVSEKGCGVYSSTEKALALEGFITDITQQKLAEESLIRARDAAEQADRAKSEFLATVSHELRTPLNGVIGMTELLLEGELSEQQREYMHVVATSGQALLGIINDILDFSKLQAGRMEIEQIDFDLHQHLREVHDMVTPRARQKGLTCDLQIAPAVPRRASGDPGRLRQILLNLADNAVKFTEQGGITLSASAEPTGAGTAVRFAVRDSGIGIPTDRRYRLFRAFSQVDASTTRRFGGTGLGLAICKELVERMGGEIGVESEVGYGSTFWFRLPLAAAAPSPPPATERSAALARPDLSSAARSRKATDRTEPR